MPKRKEAEREKREKPRERERERRKAEKEKVVPRLVAAHGAGERARSLAMVALVRAMR